jgi:hypothetical protein
VFQGAVFRDGGRDSSLQVKLNADIRERLGKECGWVG